MSNWLFKKLAPYAKAYREWSKDKLWAQIPLWILINLCEYIVGISRNNTKKISLIKKDETTYSF